MSDEHNKVKEEGVAWRAASDSGVDMSLIKANLRLTPQERLRAHGRALKIADNLQRGMRERHE